MKSVYVDDTDPTKIIRFPIHIRRREGHDPIPDFSEFVGCPPRQRMSNDEFAARYGAHQDDLDAVKSHYQALGFTLLSEHAARRHVILTGTAQLVNDTFKVKLQNHKKGNGHFHKPNKEPTVHHTVKDKIVHVGLGREPHDRALSRPWPIGEIHNSTDGYPAPNAPAGANDVAGFAGSNPATPAQIMAAYNWPNGGAAGQSIAIIIEQLSPTDDGYTLNDITASCANWGIPNPTIVDIKVDGVNGNKSTTPGFKAGEWNMDITMATGFAIGATIAVYFQGNASFEEVYGRIAHPNAGDPVCSVTSLSAAYFDEATIYRDQPSLVPVIKAMYQDAALQGVTVLLGTQDLLSGADLGDGQAHAAGSVTPWATVIGGTTIGNPADVPLKEWLWNQAQDPATSTYQVGANGGVSIYEPLPSYQVGVGVPNAFISGAVGRGIPDVCCIAAPQTTFYVNGGKTSGGGVSQAIPVFAGFIASLNKSLGRNVGFITPTLYAGSSQFMRDINPSAGGPQTNAGGYNHTLTNPQTNGYPVTNGWDACTGLGVINGGQFLSYLQNLTYYVKIQAVSGGVTGALSAAVPVLQNVTPDITNLHAVSHTSNSLTMGWNTVPGYTYSTFAVFYALQPSGASTQANQTPVQTSSNVWQITITGLTVGSYNVAVLAFSNEKGWAADYVSQLGSVA